ncbi:lytic transglycosylase domain-containing protein [Janthinobacterium sp. 17J80-10]|uniref:lytic transglycosylase domain-containing protein n=1 Tax=Janthinobacterium sp. 17J80-10 TaxID=2497863 RepID=UPI0010056F22|nr:lytic transglycosylase domain-containing protein [Janthinobacterium sp. 17J80-10]QAU33298.1 lytic transglycosylase domain-containing protein [Janthinobacterium sp. 17J80-10]
MSSLTRVASLVFSVVAIVLALPVAHAAGDDDIFMALRDAARRNDAAQAGELAARLPNYAIPSYVDYYRLKPRLKDASGAEIRDYLARYDGTAIADRLRNDWLLELGRKRDWAAFDAQLPLYVVNDDMQVKCYALLSKLSRGATVADDARALLTSPKEYGEACQTLVSALVEAGQFNADDVWAQIRLAAENGQAAVARRLAPLAGGDEKRVGLAIEHPVVFVARGVGSGRAERETFIVALGRAAKQSPEQAANALSMRAEDKLSAKEQALGWAQIALQASYKLAPEAATWWTRAQGAPLSPEGQQWKVRIALRNEDWRSVRSGIEAMPEALRNDPAWVYWRGRALQAAGKDEDARQLYRSIADQFHFYGQLATEELAQKISIPQAATPVTAAELAATEANAGLRRALKFFAMDLRFEGVREWNWEMRHMKSEREFLAAAEFARQNNVLDRMVNSADRTRSEHDFDQRFPTPFRDVMYRTTQSLGMDMAWVYGLIRQESRFIMHAKSHVGASGLMQLMPATARLVAKKIGMTDFDHAQVNHVDTNIALGTNYLNMVLTELDGSQALATAAYNAGPGRPRAWRSTLTRTVEGAIFAETIPFSETRGYVKNVLSNATYYAALFEGKPQSLKARLGTVTPKGMVQTEQQ